MGLRGAATSAHPLASMAGIEILLAGGNAVDAAVAVAAALNVVEPFMSSVGGIGLMLVSRPNGERHVLDFIGRAPAAADAAGATEADLAGGPKSCATPGNLGGWLAALERFGSMPRSAVLSPAIALAERGVPLSWKNVEFFKWMDLDPASPNVLRPGRQAGTMMSPTQVFRRGAFALSIGTPGSYGILQTQAQMMLNVLEFGLNVQEAIEAPRLRVYRDRLVDAEARIPHDVREALGRRGHQVNVIDDWSWIVGGGQGIARDPETGALMAGADPRRDGYALAV